MANPSVTLTGTAGMVLTRLLVPAWISTGAIIKLSEATSKLLPQTMIVQPANKLGIDLDSLLALLITIEILAAAVMFLVARYARAVAAFMLTCFCVILVGEILGGAESCGCLGSIKVNPWIMLSIDGALLLGVILLKPHVSEASKTRQWPVLVAAILGLVGAGSSFGRIVLALGTPGPEPDGNGGSIVDPTDPTVNPAPAELPRYWLTENLDSWVGRPWREFDLFTFMRRWPTSMDQGTRYVVFYGRTCDHCEEMFIFDLSPDPQLSSMVAAVEVPVDRTHLRDEDASWPMPETACELLALPVGPDWIITTPLTLRIENGVIRCIEEGSHKRCMGLE